MKYYSEETGKLYNTESECAEAIKTYYLDKEKKEQKERELKAFENEMLEDLHKKEKEIKEKTQEYYNLIAKYYKTFNKLYGYKISNPFDFWFNI